MSYVKKTFLLSVLLIMILVISACGSDNKDASTDEGNDEDFYKGETVEYLVPFAPGGGTDTVARLLAPYFSEHIKGEPSVQVVNEPGSGGVSGSNKFERSKDDGLTLFNSSSSVLVQWMLGRPEVEFDVSDWTPLMAIPSNDVLNISPDTGYKEPKDLIDLAPTLKWGAEDPTSGDLRMLLALETLGIADDLTVVFGYEGSGPKRIAYEQGETNMANESTAAYNSEIKELEKEGKSQPLFQLGRLDENGDLERDPALAEIPTITEFYEEIHGEEPTGDTFEAMKLFGGLVNNIHKTIFVKSDIPQSAMNILEEAVDNISKDESFIEDVEKAYGDDTVIVGEDILPSSEKLENIDKKALEHVREILKDKYDVNLD